MAIELLSQQLVGIRRETVRNTAEMVPNITLKVDSCTVEQKVEYTLDEVVYGHRSNNYDEYANKSFVEGEITGHINNRDIATLLALAFGSSTPTQILSSTAYRHTMTPLNATTLPTFTLFDKRGDAGYYKSRGCVIDELSLEIGESESKFTATIKGLEETKVTNTTEINNILAAISYGTPDPKFTFGNLVVTHAASITALGAVTNNTPGTGTVIPVKPDVTINIANNVEYDMSTSSVSRARILPLDTIAQKSEASVEMSGYIRDDVPYLWTQNAVARAYELLFVNTGAANVGTSTVKPEMRIRISQAIAKVETDKTLNEAMAFNINLDNLINTVADGFAIQCSVINTLTTL